MTKYMLDTNICIAIMKGHTAIRSKISRIDPPKICTSGIVLAELSYGVWKSQQRERNKLALADFCSICNIWDWPVQAADTYGEIRTFLEQQGRIIGPNDPFPIVFCPPTTDHRPPTTAHCPLTTDHRLPTTTHLKSAPQLSQSPRYSPPPLPPRSSHACGTTQPASKNSGHARFPSAPAVSNPDHAQ